jgi:PKD repeat protein
VRKKLFSKEREKMIMQKNLLCRVLKCTFVFVVAVFVIGIPAMEHAQAQECVSQWVVDACDVGCEAAFWTCDAGCATCGAGCEAAFWTCDAGCATCGAGCEAAFGTCDAGCATCDAGCEAAFWTCDAGCDMCGVGEELCKLGCSGVEGLCGLTCDAGEGFCYVGCGTVFAGCVATIPVRCWPWDYDDCYDSCENILNGCTAGCDIDCSYCILNCEAGCEADCDACQSACDNARGVCYTGCDTCQSGCDSARGDCYVGCDTCQSGCDSARGDCYSGCDTCQSGCDSARAVCEAGCQSYNPCQQIGEWCQPTPGLPGECAAGLSCIPTFGLNQFNNNVFTCFPSDTDDVFPDDICRSFYSPDLHNIAINNNMVMSYGAGGAFGVLAGVSQEVGTVYGPDGSYGCYYSHCEGVSAGLELPLTINPSVCVGTDESIDAFHGQQLVATQDLSLGIMVSKIGPTVFNPDATGSAICVGLDLPGFSVGIYNCHTVVDIVSLISATNGEIVYITSNPPPVADPNGPYGGIVGAAVHFDGSASFDLDGSIVSYEWDFGDDTTGTGVDPTHTYALAGTHTVSLTVTDNENMTDTASSSVTIGEEPCVDLTDCTDDNLCNGEETCENGICMPGLPIICGDTDACTDDSCDASDGCVFTPIPDCTTGVCVDHIDCSDDNLCNGEETCQYEICMPGTPLICNDADACTVDICDSTTGCANIPISCDDQNACTEDFCYPQVGCLNEPIPGCGEECDVTLSVGDASAAPGDSSVQVPVSMKNPSDKVLAIETVLLDEENSLTCTGCAPYRDRAPGFICFAQELDDGGCKVVMVDPTNPTGVIEQGDGPIFTVEYMISGGALSNECISVTPTDSIIADSLEDPLTVCEESGDICFIGCGDVYPGESCGDGVVNIFDILEEIDIVLGITEPSACQAEQANVPTSLPPDCVDPDDDINIFDVLVIIDKALDKPNCCDAYDFQ